MTDEMSVSLLYNELFVLLLFKIIADGSNLQILQSQNSISLHIVWTKEHF